MEKRSAVRIRKRVMASVDSKMGFTVDLSERGMQVASRQAPHTRLFPLKIQAGEKTFDLTARLCWCKEELSIQRNQRLGLMIENPPAEYISFIQSLTH